MDRLRQVEECRLLITSDHQSWAIVARGTQKIPARWGCSWEFTVGTATLVEGVLHQQSEKTWSPIAISV